MSSWSKHVRVRREPRSVGRYMGLYKWDMCHHSYHRIGCTCPDTCHTKEHTNSYISDLWMKGSQWDFLLALQTCINTAELTLHNHRGLLPSWVSLSLRIQSPYSPHRDKAPSLIRERNCATQAGQQARIFPSVIPCSPTASETERT